jgi:hypothetical protein
MTFHRQSNSNLNQDEWNEMEALKNAMNHDVSQVHPDRMEKFTDYLVRTLRERGG